MSRATAFIGRVLEVRLRAFAYALCAVVGFILGTMNTTAMCERGIEQLGNGINAMIARGAGQ